MQDTIDYSIVFAKTPKGVAEINARSGALTLQARRVLIMIDGRRPVAELMAVVRTGEFEGILTTLEAQAMIEKVDLSALPERDYELEDFADTISLLQENAAALRSLPNVSPATIAQQAQPAQSRPATIAAEPPAEAADDAAAIAAKAVATASAPRAAESPVRRPPTLTGMSPVTTRDMAAGTARPGTVNVPIKQSEQPVRRPATLTGSRPALATERPALATEHPGAAVEAPPRPAAAPEKVPTRVETQPAPASRTLEEEKRLVVSELYSVLGPYAEQSVPKLQECPTLEALKEQVKQASKRVAMFRGDKAANDYLRTIGHGL